MRKRAHTKTVSVERCHPRIVWQRKTVWVTVRRHGKLVAVKRTKRVRVPLIPHTVMKTKKRVGYGRGTTVTGWLGTASGVAIGGVPVEILTAPNNGQGQFIVAAAAKTAADGAWSAQLGPGPSRLVEAVYGGSASLLPVTSTPVELNVPARITLSVSSADRAVGQSGHPARASRGRVRPAGWRRAPTTDRLTPSGSAV